MLAYALRRIVVSVPLLVGVSLLVFLILRLIPGDPAQILLFGANPTPDMVAELRHQLGLDQSAPAQYWLYAQRLVRGDLGYSYVTNSPVMSEIAARLPYTIELALAALGVALVLGFVTGILAGMWPGSVIDRIATVVSVLGLAVPYFWLAQLLVLIFAVRLGWLPALGLGGPTAIVLPALSLGLGFAAIITRLLRSSLIEVYQQPYLLVARAKGMAPSRLLVRHALRNAVGSVVTVIGLQIGNLFAGAVAIEIIFGRPGLGQYLVSSIQQKDIPAIQGVVLFVAVVYIGVNLLVDLAHGVLDPRVRLGWSR
ncbi:ABC-type transporter, integral membrane subunit [Pseudonocardia dioxanivorans CB1190]|jgi:ABC-type dipeptide/oligopeptide/nickel transport system permease component|uniref:ABC-type transporter, integral membrane subunit n=1 Tax=Pseudonocardia dioxanivorans (strain ATCC 55486 / DSM 44775 / JCM 13855 / CB1190) TaxID=675635 RepID=F4CK22_PSEUX|nr:ABC transporter permease [Pseudonocardia dioxanivorans]AEA28128.1 ABC-type transporter, integral membrane subunit [Pseudonocardia dioxanivorans CB1190]